jgi:hypothetical protein
MRPDVEALTGGNPMRPTLLETLQTVERKNAPEYIRHDMQRGKLKRE